MPEDEGVGAWPDYPGRYRLVDRGDHGDRCLSEYLGHVIKTEFTTEDGGGLEHAAGALAEPGKPAAGRVTQPPRQLRCDQDRRSAIYLDRVFLLEPADELGQQERVPRRAGGQLEQARIGHGAEDVGNRARDGLAVERPK